VIEVESVTKEYGPVTAVEDLSFSVAAGEILGFLGPNGAGKTTTMRVLTGFFPPTRGSVKVAGFDVASQPLAAKKAIGYLPETPPVYPEMTVVDYVDFVARIKGVPGNERLDRVDHALERCALTAVRSKLTSKLSKGYKQRVGLAQAIVHDPAVLVLDEPTSGLDPKQINDTRELIRSLGGDHTVILSTHILPEVSMTCDRVVIIHGGRLVAQGTPSSLEEQFRREDSLEITVQGEAAEIEAVLGAVEGVVSVSAATASEGDEVFSYRLEVDHGRDLRRVLSERIVESGLGLLELHRSGMSLEEVYLRAISREGS